MVTEARSNYSCEARISLSLPSVPTCFSNPSLAICGGQLLPLWSTRNLDAKFQSNACFPEELHLPSHDILLLCLISCFCLSWSHAAPFIRLLISFRSTHHHVYSFETRMRTPLLLLPASLRRGTSLPRVSFAFDHSPPSCSVLSGPRCFSREALKHMPSFGDKMYFLETKSFTA